MLDEEAMVVRITEFDPSGALRATPTCFEHALRVCREGGAKVGRFHCVRLLPGFIYAHEVNVANVLKRERDAARPSPHNPIITRQPDPVFLFKLCAAGVVFLYMAVLNN